MRTAVVTGASRGIGSEFVVRLLDDGWRVYAGYRSDTVSYTHLTLPTRFSV